MNRFINLSGIVLASLLVFLVAACGSTSSAGQASGSTATGHIPVATPRLTSQVSECGAEFPLTASDVNEIVGPGYTFNSHLGGCNFDGPNGSFIGIGDYTNAASGGWDGIVSRQKARGSDLYQKVDGVGDDAFLSLHTAIYFTRHTLIYEISGVQFADDTLIALARRAVARIDMGGIG